MNCNVYRSDAEEIEMKHVAWQKANALNDQVEKQAVRCTFLLQELSQCQSRSRSNAMFWLVLLLLTCRSCPVHRNTPSASQCHKRNRTLRAIVSNVAEIDARVTDESRPEKAQAADANRTQKALRQWRNRRRNNWKSRVPARRRTSLVELRKAAS